MGEDPASPPPASVAARQRRFTEEVLAVMERRGISRSELARRLGASPAYVTKILRGDANFTLASMVKLAAALDAELEIGLRASGTRSPRDSIRDTIPATDAAVTGRRDPARRPAPVSTRRRATGRDTSWRVW